jgi:hypothetical protein
MARHQAMSGVAILMFRKTLGQHIFFLRLKHRELADFIQITIETTLGSQDRHIIPGHRAPLSCGFLCGKPRRASHGLRPFAYLGVVAADSRQQQSRQRET